MKETVGIIRAAVAQHPRFVVAVSGGTDSAIVLDLVARYAPVPPVAILHVDVPGLQPVETLRHVEDLARRYGFELHVARADETAPDLWQRRGLLPIAGKTAGRKWTASHPGFGFRADPSSCCQAMKLRPGRAATKALGCTAQIVGLRGQADSSSRGLHAIKRGQSWEADGLSIVAPIQYWTDLRTASYVRRHRLPLLDPLEVAEPGCVGCYGGAMFTGSSPSRARRTHAPMLRRLFLETDLGFAALAAKYNATLPTVREAVARAGGVERLLAERPCVFDFLRPRPMPGNEKGVGTTDTPPFAQEAP